MRALPTGGARALIAYILDTQGKANRVQYVLSGLVSDPQDIDACVNELKLFAGAKYDALACRISFAESDKLDEGQAGEYVGRFVVEYLGDRPYVAVTHNDTQNQHIHIISGFLDSNGKSLNFRGRRAHAEGIRRMEIVDRLSAEYGLQVTPREEGRYTQARDRKPIAVERMRESEGRYIWTDDLKTRIKTAIQTAKNKAEFIAILALQSVGVRYRGSGVSYDFTDSQGKKRTARGRKLGTDYEPFCRAREQTRDREADRVRGPEQPER